MFRLSGPVLVSAAKELFKVVIPGMHGIHLPDKSSLTIRFSINIIKQYKQIVTSETLVIWSFSRSNYGIHMPFSDGFDWSTGFSMNYRGMGHWKRLIKISGGTDCYYCINHMTCLIHVYYYLFILVTLTAILFTTMSHVYLTLLVFFTDTLFMYTYTLHFMYSLFYVFSVDTLFWYNHKHCSVITSVYFMFRCSYLSSLYCHVISTISSNSKYKVIKTWHV